MTSYESLLLSLCPKWDWDWAWAWAWDSVRVFDPGLDPSTNLVLVFFDLRWRNSIKTRVKANE